MSIKRITPITKHPVNDKTIVWCSYHDGQGFYSLVDGLETTDKINVTAYSLRDLMVTPELQAKIRMWVWQNVCTQSPDELVKCCKSASPYYRIDLMNESVSDEHSKQFYTHMLNLCETMVETNGTRKITF